MQVYDKLWKGIIEDLFDDFLHFYFPDLVSLIDFSKPFEFLDQELALLFPEAENKNRAADKLVKVYFLNGDEAWFLSHIEVQGYHDDTFQKRMYISHYRITDRYNKKVVALAIYTDKNKYFKPNIYESHFHGTEIKYKFRTYKVLEQDKNILEKSDNPFALVVLAVLSALEKGTAKDDEIMTIKRNLVRLLFERNYKKNTIIKLFRFINYYIRFENSKNYSIFAKDIQSTFLNQKKNMGIEEILIEDARHEGEIIGIEKGEIIGIEKGIILLISNVMKKHPKWSDEKIADLLEVSTETVMSVRINLVS